MRKAHAFLTTGEVAQMFGVDPKTVSRWAKDGKLAAGRTPGGRFRFSRQVVEAALQVSGASSQLTSDGGESR